MKHMHALVILGFGFVFSSVAAHAAILRVNELASPGGDGSSWVRAYDDLQDALAVATNGDQIWVAKGSYAPSVPAGEDATFLIPDGVRVYGGFSGGENNLGDRGDPLLTPTTLSGRLGGLNAAYSIVTILNAGTNTVLDGFYLADGIADGSGSQARHYGGAIFADNSSPTLRNLDIAECNADSRGGAIALLGTGPGFAIIDKCEFAENIAGTRGGALYAEASVIVTDSEFVYNSSPGTGGAISLGGTGSYFFDGCGFRNNSTSDGPGGAASVILQSNAGSSTFSDCEFRQNSGQVTGAINYLALGSHTIRSCRFFGNDSQSVGPGAVRFDPTSDLPTLLLENSLITGNTSVSGPGAVSNDGPASMQISNCTIAENHGGGTGGGVFLSSGDTTIFNTIIWGNTSAVSAGQDLSVWTNLLSSVLVYNSILENLGVGAPVPSGSGTLGVNPMFVDLDGVDNTIGTSDDDPTLMPGSIAIDRGNNLAVSAEVFSDIDGNSRFVDDPATIDTGVSDGSNAIVDLGASEFQPAPCLADFTGDGLLDIFDVFAFLDAFNAGETQADFTGDGTLDIFDVFAFLDQFNAGCP